MALYMPTHYTRVVLLLLRWLREEIGAQSHACMARGPMADPNKPNSFIDRESLMLLEGFYLAQPIVYYYYICHIVSQSKREFILKL